MFVAIKEPSGHSLGLIINIRNLEPTFVHVAVSHCSMQTISLIRAQDGRVLPDQYIQRQSQLKWTGVILWFELRYFALVVMRILVMFLKMAQPQQAFASV